MTNAIHQADCITSVPSSPLCYKSQAIHQSSSSPTAMAKPHFILVPLMAQGHMIPMVDLSRLLASAGASVTLITTPINAARIRPAIESLRRSGLPIHLIQLRFPAAEVGLPAGCENMDLISSPDLFKLFFDALPLLKPQLKLYLAAGPAPPPDCVIFDSLNSWAAAAAKELGIPHLIFHGPSCLYNLSSLLVKKSQVLKTITGDFELFTIPGLPEHVQVMKAHVNLWMDDPNFEKLREEYYAGEQSSDGVVMNTFEELEFPCLEKYREETGKKVWPIGPLSLNNKDVDNQATRGRTSSIDIEWLINWLDSKAPNSVMLVSFGSLAQNPLSQLREIGKGLESALLSSALLSFIWVVREIEEIEDGEKWLSEFEGKMEKRGLVIRGWAPQVVILGHPAVGGFMTHCGWNSILEAVAAGVVMATWPRFGDQFMNEKLVVEVLKVGVAVGAKAPIFFGNEVCEEALVEGENVRKAVESVMDGGKEGEKRRMRARELGEKANKVMQEGGSSYENLKGIIHWIMQNKRTK